MEASDRLWTVLTERYPGGEWVREWPVFERRGGQCLIGEVDLAGFGPVDVVVVDHKASLDSTEVLVGRYAGQLGAYSAVLGPGPRWLHLVLRGELVAIG